jgi:putative endonuclease
MWYLYITKTQNGSFYTGITIDIKRRFQEHQRKENNPAIKLLYKESFIDKHDAAKREKQIKGWTRNKKMALIAGNLFLLKKL